MKKKILFVNIILVICMVLLTYKLKTDWDQWNKTHDLESILKKVKIVPPKIHIPEVSIPTSHVNMADVKYIGDNNLFHRDRNMNLPQNKSAEKGDAPSRLNNPPVIIGMISIDGKRIVQVVPSVTSRRGKEKSFKRALQLSVGDKWEDQWTLSDIENDRIVLTSGETKEEVLFHDPTKRTRKKRYARKRVSSGKSSVLTIGSSTKGSNLMSRRVATERREPKKTIIVSRIRSAISSRRNSRNSRSRNSIFGQRNSMFDSRNNNSRFNSNNSFRNNSGGTNRTYSSPFGSGQRRKY